MTDNAFEVVSIAANVRVLEVVEAATVEERRHDFDDALGTTRDEALNLDGLASVAIANRDDASLSLADVARLERRGAFEQTEAVGKVNQLEKVAIDRRREDRLHDGL